MSSCCGRDAGLTPSLTELLQSRLKKVNRVFPGTFLAVVLDDENNVVCTMQGDKREFKPLKLWRDLKIDST